MSEYATGWLLDQIITVTQEDAHMARLRLAEVIEVLEGRQGGLVFGMVSTLVDPEKIQLAIKLAREGLASLVDTSGNGSNGGRGEVRVYTW